VLREQKLGSLDQPVALPGGALSPAFSDLRRILKTRIGNRGKREFVQMLRLMETFPESAIEKDIGDASDSPHLASMPLSNW
jgi:hypothetical protein